MIADGEKRSRGDSGSQLSYFDIQAYMGTTKHMGGFESTQTLIELCHIDENVYVLDIGCGVGATACHLARAYGCRVVGIDLREAMIENARDRARRERVEDRVEFRVEDVQALSFHEGMFDAVLCESVLTFVSDRPKAVAELARVLKPGGYVGLNEEVWIERPPAGMMERIGDIWDIEVDLPTSGEWLGWLESAGLRDVVVRSLTVDARREATQVKRYRLRDIAGMLYRALALYIKSSEMRRYMRGRRLPKDLFQYLGYALLVGRKQG